MNAAHPPGGGRSGQGPSSRPRPDRSPPGLGPHCVGQRVVVRRIVRGETGPSGGPAMTDLLGVMEVWDAEARTTTVRPEDGPAVAIPLADIVSGKPVPPRPSPRLRVPAADAERRALAGWRAVECAPLGEWVLRAAGGFSARANSALAAGDPGVPVPEALGQVRSFYDARGLPPWAQVVVGSEEHAALADAGWVEARPGEADTAFQVASVAQAVRAVRRALSRPAGSRGPAARSATWSATATPEWLADDARAARHPDAARAVLEGADQVGFCTIGDAAGPVQAKGRVSTDGDWAGITDVWVAPEQRRRGLALVVMAELLDWAAERGATTAYLQTRGDNPAALALYERLGFRTHHEYRYLTAP